MFRWDRAPPASGAPIEAPPPTGCSSSGAATESRTASEDDDFSTAPPGPVSVASCVTSPVRSRRAVQLNLPDNWSQHTVCPMCRWREPRRVDERQLLCRFCKARGYVTYVQWIEEEDDDPHDTHSSKAPVQVPGSLYEARRGHSQPAQ